MNDVKSLESFTAKIDAWTAKISANADGNEKKVIRRAFLDFEKASRGRRKRLLEGEVEEDAGSGSGTK